jgi:16S rRNA (guanine527-N7)-methyltransferase
MDTTRIAELLRPYMAEAVPPPKLLEQLQRYLELLLRWNARTNLTGVRDPEQVVARHFGESLFAARALFPERQGTQRSPSPGAEFSSHSDGQPESRPENLLRLRTTLADVGSGAGFPGIPMKLYAPELDLTLIESRSKKATFLGEVVRTLGLDRTEVFCGRAQDWGGKADLVTLRAVEQFERALPVASGLVATAGRLCLLIGAQQVPTAQRILGAHWTWQLPNAVPQSTGRVVSVGCRR